MGNTYDSEIQIVKEQLKIRSTDTANTITNEINRKIKLAIPKFKGTENERPIKFLNELQKYIAVMKPNTNELVCILAQALTEDAHNWWYIIENEIDDYDIFEEKVKNKYWNNDIQRTEKRKIEFGQYYKNGKLIRVNYATSILGLTK